MKQIWQRIRNNLVTRRALEVLGPALFARYLATFLRELPAIQKQRNFVPLDRAMASFAKDFYYRGRHFAFDCAYCDDVIRDGSYAFGAVRELYIRDCYFCFQPPHIYEQADVVVDVGANRGAFSSLMTTRARRIVSIEAQLPYISVIHHQMMCNAYTNYNTVHALVGEGGLFRPEGVPCMSMEEIFQAQGLEQIDFLKMDIEGSEFALFSSPAWLSRVRALSMEVHPQSGELGALLAPLRAEGFRVIVADDRLNQVQSLRDTGFLYAWRER